MRISHVMTLMAVLAVAPAVMSTTVAPAQAQECTGENCPPSTGQGGGHECESEKKEQTIS